jgi:hypothetical protein
MIRLYSQTLIFGSECGTVSMYALPQDIRRPSPKLVESFKVGYKKVLDCVMVKGEDNEQNLYVLMEGTILLLQIT